MLLMNNEINLLIMSHLPQQLKYVDDGIDSHGLIRDTAFIILYMNYERNLLIMS